MARRNKRSRLLENAISGLRHLDFVAYKNIDAFCHAQKIGTVPVRYLIRHYPHPSLFGTRGYKEAFIHNNGVEYIFEAKYQDFSGSVDEKAPYLFEAFLVSHVANWIVWFDGKWVTTPRAVAAISWLRKRADAIIDGRQFFVCASEDEWVTLVDSLFKIHQ
jgi:hypothetical protein